MKKNVSPTSGIRGIALVALLAAIFAAYVGEFAEKTVHLLRVRIKREPDERFSISQVNAVVQSHMAEDLLIVSLSSAERVRGEMRVTFAPVAQAAALDATQFVCRVNGRAVAADAIEPDGDGQLKFWVAPDDNRPNALLIAARDVTGAALGGVLIRNYAGRNRPFPNYLVQRGRKKNALGGTACSATGERLKVFGLGFAGFVAGLSALSGVCGFRAVCPAALPALLMAVANWGFNFLTPYSFTWRRLDLVVLIAGSILLTLLPIVFARRSGKPEPATGRTVDVVA